MVKILFGKNPMGRHTEYLADFHPIGDYGFITAGSSLSIQSGIKSQEGSEDLDFQFWKVSESGSTDWQRSFGGSASDLLKVIQNTPDRGFILGGNNDYFDLKLKEEGSYLMAGTFSS